MAGGVADDVGAVLDGWTARGRRLFDELMEDAGSELQRELVQRAVLAGHSPGEVHAFADELRGLADDECYEACTIDDETPADYTVAQLLRAQADPLYAFELKGGTITPNEADDVPSGALPVQRRDQLDVPIDRALAADPIRQAKARRESFTAESAGARPAPAPRPGALGGDAVPPSGAFRVPAAVAGRLLEDVLGEATRALGVAWRELELDVPGGVSMEAGLQQVAQALQRGLPAAGVIGTAQGRALRPLVVLQVSTSGATRAFQLYEPFSQALVWANEKDLLAKGELPFDDKSLRRLLRVVVPAGRGLGVAPGARSSP
ncbi:MAG: hypothetical protein INH41_17025 [Myxococcaceae bacterium]|nr:hypothetical protein [Myxococcaceae bacterium]